MTDAHACYLAEKFVREGRWQSVEKRLAFDAWADRHGLTPWGKLDVWRRVKALTRRVPQENPEGEMLSLKPGPTRSEDLASFRWRARSRHSGP